MKKYFFSLIALLALNISSFILSSQKHIDSIKHFGQQFGADISNYELFYEKPGVLAGQAYHSWLDAFFAAESFVMNNSKNLARMVDSDIKKCLDTLKEIHTEITLAMEKIPNFQYNQQLQQMEKMLNAINTKLDNSTIQLNKVNFTLSNKIEARKVLNEMKNILKWIVTYKLIPITTRKIGRLK